VNSADLLSKTTTTEGVYFDANQTGKLYDVNIFEWGQKQKTLRTFRSPKARPGVSRANRNDLTAFGVAFGVYSHVGYAFVPIGFLLNAASAPANDPNSPAEANCGQSLE
jgi:hypothetical protein